MLQGKKTYLIAAATVVYGVAGFLAGIHGADTAVDLILQGLGFGALRAGVSTSKN